MTACGLRRDHRRIGKLARRQGAAIAERAQNVGARRIADQRRHGGHVEHFAHAFSIARRADRHFGEFRSIRR
jgi:hypothetical protein